MQNGGVSCEPRDLTSLYGGDVRPSRWVSPHESLAQEAAWTRFPFAAFSTISATSLFRVDVVASGGVFPSPPGRETGRVCFLLNSNSVRTATMRLTCGSQPDCGACRGSALRSGG